MVKRCYYKPTRSKPRHFKKCDVVRVAKSAVDNGASRKDILVELAESFGFKSVLDGGKVDAKGLATLVFGFVRDEAKITEVFTREGFGSAARKFALRVLSRAALYLLPLLAVVVSVIIETATIKRDNEGKC